MTDYALIAAYTYDEYIEPRANLAVVELTPDRVKDYIHLIRQGKLLQERFRSFYHLALFDSTPWFYELTEEQMEEWHRGYDELLLASNLEVDEESIRMDGTVMRITRTGISWSTYIKHTNVLVETAEITEEFLRGNATRVG